VAEVPEGANGGLLDEDDFALTVRRLQGLQHSIAALLMPVEDGWRVHYFSRPSFEPMPGTDFPDFHDALDAIYLSVHHDPAPLFSGIAGVFAERAYPRSEGRKRPLMAEVNRLTRPTSGACGWIAPGARSRKHDGAVRMAKSASGQIRQRRFVRQNAGSDPSRAVPLRRGATAGSGSSRTLGAGV
jgi:hypothetical protein